MERVRIMFVVVILTVNSKGLKISHIYFKGNKIYLLTAFSEHQVNTNIPALTKMLTKTILFQQLLRLSQIIHLYRQYRHKSAYN